MDLMLWGESAKLSLSLISALADIAEKAEREQNPSLQAILGELRPEAIRLGREIEHNIDDFAHRVQSFDVSLNSTFAQGEEIASQKHILGKARFRRLCDQFWRTLSDIKDFYADVEAAFTCVEQYRMISENVVSAYAVRSKLDSITAAGTTLKDAVEALRSVNNSILKRLGA